MSEISGCSGTPADSDDELGLPYDVLRPAEFAINLDQVAIEASLRIELSHKILLAEVTRLRGELHKAHVVISDMHADRRETESQLRDERDNVKLLQKNLDWVRAAIWGTTEHPGPNCEAAVYDAFDEHRRLESVRGDLVAAQAEQENIFKIDKEWRDKYHALERELAEARADAESWSQQSDRLLTAANEAQSELAETSEAYRRLNVHFDRVAAERDATQAEATRLRDVATAAQHVAAHRLQEIVAKDRELAGLRAERDNFEALAARHYHEARELRAGLRAQQDDSGDDTGEAK